MTSEDPVRPEDVFPDWIGRQTLKATLTPGFVPAEHRDALRIISERLLTDETIAGGKVSSTLRAISRNPSLTRSDLTEEVFNGNAGYTLQILWPLVSIFAGLMPRKIASSTATSYLSWLDRIRRVVLRDLPRELGQAVTAVLEAVSDCYAQAAGSPSGEGAEAARGVAGASSRVDTNEPGIYVFTTPTYLAYPPPDRTARALHHLGEVPRLKLRFRLCGRGAQDSQAPCRSAPWAGSRWNSKVISDRRRNGMVHHPLAIHRDAR